MAEEVPKPHRRVVLVTGCARGIGAGVVDHMVSLGWCVTGVDEDSDGQALLANAAKDAGLFVPGDVSDPETAARALAATVERFGRLDGLVNNAGISDPVTGPLEELDLSAWRRYLDVHLTGAFAFMQAAVPALRDSRGSIVNITSTRALQSEPHCEAYAAAKGALSSLTHAAAISLGPEIRVNSVAPGWIDTRGTATTVVDSDLREVDHRQHPAGRVGTPADVAQAVAWLLDDDNAFVTGQQLVIDGGMTRKMTYAH